MSASDRRQRQIWILEGEIERLKREQEFERKMIEAGGIPLGDGAYRFARWHG